MGDGEVAAKVWGVGRLPSVQAVVERIFRGPFDDSRMGRPARGKLASCLVVWDVSRLDALAGWHAR